MPGTITSTNLDHSLTAAKGWFEMAALDFQSAIDPSVISPVQDGRCMHLYLYGRYPKNCTVKTGVTSTSMPLFVWHGNTDYDVANTASLPNGRFMMQSIGPTGIAQFLVAKGAYELETTEYDTSWNNGAYAANTLLTAIANDSGTTGGLITGKGSSVSTVELQRLCNRLLTFGRGE